MGDGDSDTSPALTRVACDSHAGPARATILWKPPSRHTQPQSPSTDTVAKRLKRWTRNPLDSARRGSNPLGVAFYPMMLDMNSLSPVGWSSLTFKPVICRLRSAAKEKQGAGWPVYPAGVFALCPIAQLLASIFFTAKCDQDGGLRVARMDMKCATCNEAHLVGIAGRFLSATWAYKRWPPCPLRFVRAKEAGTFLQNKRRRVSGTWCRAARLNEAQLKDCCGGRTHALAD